MALPRKAWVEIFYSDENITESIADSVISLTYSDKASGEADELQLTLHDRDGLWHNDWYPQFSHISPGEGDDFSEIAKALQQGTSASNLQALINSTDLTPEQGAVLQRVTNSAGWPQIIAQHPQYIGEAGKLRLIEDILAGGIT
jgi:hypothetical protein